MSRKIEAASWKPSSDSQMAKVVREMRALADEYEDSAEMLSGKLAPHGHAVAILSVLALEIRLKCAVLVEIKCRPRGHDYWLLWEMLARATRERILTDAMRHSPNFDDDGEILQDYGDLEIVLRRLKELFEKGRYSYELNDSRTPDEMKAAGDAWIANGAKSEDADLAFYPAQRDGLNYGLKIWLEAQSKAA